jgi:ribosomal protein L44E
MLVVTVDARKAHTQTTSSRHGPRRRGLEGETVHTFPRPAQERVFVDRERLDATCDECGGDDVRGYRVLSEGGWWQVAKCQRCLHSLERVPASPLGSYVPLGTTV